MICSPVAEAKDVFQRFVVEPMDGVVAREQKPITSKIVGVKGWCTAVRGIPDGGVVGPRQPGRVHGHLPKWCAPVAALGRGGCGQQGQTGQTRLSLASERETQSFAAGPYGAGQTWHRLHRGI